MTLQAVVKATNRTSLVIGEISAAEVESAREEFPFVDGRGLYLISVDQNGDRTLDRVLAKFVSEDAASELAQFFRLSGRLETVA